MKDAHNNKTTVCALTPRAAIATDTTTVGTAVDLQGFEAAEFDIVSGVLTDGTFTPLVEESDDNSTYTAVADADLLGTEAAAAFDGAVAGDDAKVKSIGYIGHKRYVRLSIVSAGTTSGGFLAATCTKSHGRHQAA